MAGFRQAFWLRVNSDLCFLADGLGSSITKQLLHVASKWYELFLPLGKPVFVAYAESLSFKEFFISSRASYCFEFRQPYSDFSLRSQSNPFSLFDGQAGCSIGLLVDVLSLGLRLLKVNASSHLNLPEFNRHYPEGQKGTGIYAPASKAS